MQTVFTENIKSGQQQPDYDFDWFHDVQVSSSMND